MKLHFNKLKSIRKESKLPAKSSHQDEVHVWTHTIHYDDPFLREAPFLLSQEESMRAQKYHFEKDRRVYESGHVFIRKILSFYTSIESARLELSPLVNQKPRLEGAPFKIQFNISHSGNRILVAIGFTTDVGVDVEKIIPDFDTDGFAEANYHPNELTKLQTLKGDEEIEYFYVIWTRKEAWLKLTGEGVNDKLRELDFSGVNKQNDTESGDKKELYMTSWFEADDYIATLASYSDTKNIRFFGSELLVREASY